MAVMLRYTSYAYPVQAIKSDSAITGDYRRNCAPRNLLPVHTVSRFNKYNPVVQRQMSPCTVLR